MKPRGAKRSALQSDGLPAGRSVVSFFASFRRRGKAAKGARALFQGERLTGLQTGYKPLGEKGRTIVPLFRQLRQRALPCLRLADISQGANIRNRGIKSESRFDRRWAGARRTGARRWKAAAFGERPRPRAPESAARSCRCAPCQSAWRTADREYP